MQRRDTLDVGAHDERRMQALMAIAPLAMLETTADGLVTWANERWLKLFGSHFMDALGRPWFEAVHPDDRARVREMWRCALSEHVRMKLECRLNLGQRELYWMQIDVAQITDPVTQHATYALTFLDVTGKQLTDELARTTSSLETWAEQSAAALAEQSKDLGILAALVESLDDAIAIVAPDGMVRYVNAEFNHYFDVTADVSWADFLVKLGADENTQRALHRTSSTNESWQSTVTLERPRREPLPAEVRSFSIFDATSRKIGLAVVIRDMSLHEEAAQERARLHAEIIAAQEAAIRELSTPILPIGPGILTMPIVGDVDSARGQRILDVLLAAIHDHHSSVAILDITGVRRVDANSAEILLRAARAASLLGTSVMLTGVSAPVARALIDLGIDLRRIKTLATLEQGIRAAFSQVRTR